MPSTSIRPTIRASWTPARDAQLTRLSTELPLKEIAVVMGLYATQIYSRMERLGLAKNRKTVKRSNLKNFQNWTVAETAYFAGILDGEGTITVQKTSRKGRTYLRPAVMVSNTSLDLLHWLENIGMYATIKTNTSGNLYWLLQASGYKIDELLTKVQPYLIIKHNHSKLLLELILLRSQLGLHDQPTARMLALYDEIKSLNVRGCSLYDDLERHGTSLTLLRPTGVLSWRERSFTTVPVTT